MKPAPVDFNRITTIRLAGCYMSLIIVFDDTSFPFDLCALARRAGQIYGCEQAWVFIGKYRMDHRNEEVCRFLPTSEFLWNRLHIHMLPPIQVSGRYRIPNHTGTIRERCVTFVPVVTFASCNVILLQRYILRYHRYLL